MSVNGVRCMVQQPAKRGTYAKFTSKQRAVIGKRAAEHGVATTVRCYEKQFPDVKESSVRTWRNVYTSELKKWRREGHEDISVGEEAT